MSRLGACPLACQQFLIDIQPSTSTNKVASETHGHEVVRIVRVAMFEVFLFNQLLEAVNCTPRGRIRIPGNAPKGWRWGFEVKFYSSGRAKCPSPSLVDADSL